jgi:hypothetical protein
MGSKHKSMYQLDLLVWWRLGGRTMTPSPSLNGAATEKYAVVSDRMQSPLCDDSSQVTLGWAEKDAKAQRCLIFGRRLVPLAPSIHPNHLKLPNHVFLCKSTRIWERKIHWKADDRHNRYR